jgi:hypothetical protein
MNQMTFINRVSSILTSVLILSSMVMNSTNTYAEDRSREIDVVYSKLISALPNEGTLMAAPFAESLQTFGDDIKTRYNKESDALGGVALEIKTKRGKNPWDAGVVNPSGVAIEKGDVLYMAFFAKALKQPKDDKPAVIKNVGVQKASEPYTTIIGRDFELTSDWKSFALAGVASKSYKPNEAQISMQIATGKQEIAIGAVFLFNLGKDVDPASLPFITK